MMLKIDEYPDLRFCRIQKGTKKPFETDWPNKPYTWTEVQTFLDKECYGVLCGRGNLAVIDADDRDLQKHIDKSLPETFKVRTGSGGTHNYFFVPGLQKKIILEFPIPGTEVIKHFGEVQWQGQQVLGPGSLHPSGATYLPLNELPIVTIAVEQLMQAMKPFMQEVREVELAKQDDKQAYGSAIDDLSVASIWGTAGMKSHGSEYYGSHPQHGSEGGMNFWINPLKNTWHCFRCNSGGGPLSAIAVKEGIIQCSDAKRGNLRGEKAIEAIMMAKEKYGLKDDYKIDLNTLPLPEDPQAKPDFTLIWDKELKDYQEPDREWIIDKLIPNCSVGIWTGKRATYKTFTALEAAYAIASGTPFLDKFPTKKCKVLYLDKENGIPIVKNRVDMIKKGKGYTEDYDVGFICFSTLKLDNPRNISQIKQLVELHKPNVLFIDTYRRAISFDENDAGEVSKLFVDTLRPICEQHHLTIVLIHHDKKGTPGESHDEMDEIRGSSDLANYADWIIKNKRKGQAKQIILEQVKNRNAPEAKPFSIKFDTDDNTYFKMTYDGEFDGTPTKEDKCVEYILIWIKQNNLARFKTNEAKEVAFQNGIKKSNFYAALKEMENRGIIVQEIRGEYTVNPQSELTL